MSDAARNIGRDCNSPQLCPSCGFVLDFNPRGRNAQTEKVCPCCGIHFGYDDQIGDTETAYATWRQRWIDAGKRWWGKAPAPADFNPDGQLANLTGDAGRNNPHT